MGEQNPLKRLINWRVQAAMEPAPPNEALLKVQQPFYDLLDKHWFRLEITGWERVPVDDPGRSDDDYVRSVYDRVETAIQAGMDRLAEKRTLPVFG